MNRLVTCATLALGLLACHSAQVSAPRAISAAPSALASETPSGGSSMPVVSADGRYVAFISRSLNIVTNSTGGSYQVFLRDLAGSNVVLVSATTANIGGNDHSILPSISSNGLWIAFESEASDLVSGDTNGFSDIFVRDVAGGQTILVGGGNRASRNPIISADGRYVAFESRASDLVAGDNNSAQDVFVRDLLLGATTLASANITGSGSANRPSELLVMTPDARYVAFWSDGSDISPEGTNTLGEVYVRDIQAGTVYCLTKGIQSYGSTRRFKVVLTEDGTFATLHELSSPWGPAPGGRIFRADVPGGSASQIHLGVPGAGLAIHFDGAQIVYSGPRGIHLWEASTGTNRQIVADYGEPTPVAFVPALASFQVSRDFQQLVFASTATNYANTPRQGLQAYSHHLASTQTTIISTNMAGKPVNTGIALPFSMSESGAVVAYETAADDLAAGDRNRAPEVFVHGLGLVAARHPELPERTGTGFARLQRGNVSANGQRVAFVSTDSSLVERDTNSHYDVFVTDLVSNQLINIDGVLRSNTVSATAMSADGGSLAFERFMGSEPRGVRELYRADLRGAQVERLGVSGFASTTEPWDASWSQEGRRLVFQSGSHIWVRDFRSPAAPGLPAGGKVVDLRFDGTRVGNAASWNPRISLDGEWVVFTSRATDLTEHTGFPPNVPQVFARHLRQQRTRLLSITASGSPLPAGATNPVLSANARFAVFQTVSGSSIYRHDLLASGPVTNDLVCTNCAYPSISGDGRLVAFQSQGQIYLADFQKPFTRSIGGDRASEPTISLDGRFVAYVSRTAGVSQIYLYDRWKRTTNLLSRSFHGTAAGNGPSSRPVLSHDGRTVAFQSFASDLVPGDYNGRRDIFVVQIAPADIDRDGLDDDWEQFYLGGLHRDGTGNLDGDHQTDRDEFLAGTNPLDRASALRLTGIASRLSGPLQDTELKWTSAPGKIYRIQHKADLAAPWSDLPDEILTGGPNGTATHLAPTMPAAFYRIVLDTP